MPVPGRAFTWRDAGLLAAWTAGYAVAMVLGRATQVPPGLALAWPAAAVSVVWLLATRPGAPRAVALAVLAVTNAVVNWVTGVDPLASAVFGVVNVLHAVVALTVLAAFGWRHARPVARLHDMWVLALASVVSSVASAIAGGAIAYARMGGSLLEDVGLIGCRNTVSTFAGAVALLAVPAVHRSGGPAGRRERVLLVGGTLLATAATMAIGEDSVAFPLVPLTVVVALRCGPTLTGVLAGLQSVIVIATSAAGWGPFADIASPAGRVLLAEALVLVLVLVGLALSLEDQEREGALTRSRAAEQRLAHLALHDDLTGLPNRVLARDRLDVALSQCSRTGDAVAVMYVDVDHFKAINDDHGHAAGDVVLQEVARRVGALVRPHDTVARIGGDEFLVVCPAIGSPTRAEVIAERILAALADPVVVAGEPIPVTVSVGITVSDGRDTNVRELMRYADDALYSAKQRGRARFAVGTPDLRDRGARDARMLDELRTAMIHGDLKMEYQPIVDVGSGTPVGLEALVRWQHHERGLLPAAAFVDVLEGSDLVHQLGQLSLRLACSDGAALRAAGHDLQMHVNLSARHFDRPGLAQEVRAILEETGFPATSLTLEITETRVLVVSPTLVERLAELRALGVRIAIDDFGTGYSGLARLIELPVDVVKLDRRFVATIDEHRGARAVGSGVLAIARSLGISPVAEGIETASQEELLRSMGYPWGQGFLYCPALPSGQVLDWLRARAA